MNKPIEQILPELFDFQQSLYKKFDNKNYELIGTEIAKLQLTINSINELFMQLKHNHDELFTQLKGSKNGLDTSS